MLLRMRGCIGVCRSGHRWWWWWRCMYMCWGRCWSGYGSGNRGRN